jgi:hypothetical protein
MNTTAATYQPLIDPALEVWGAKLTGYLSAMGMVILQYDCLLTLHHEVCLIVRTSGHTPYILFADAFGLAGRAHSPKSPLLP